MSQTRTGMPTLPYLTKCLDSAFPPLRLLRVAVSSFTFADSRVIKGVISFIGD